MSPTPDEILPTLADDLALALRLADAADAVAMARFDAAGLRIDTKADRTHVTEADLATERAIREILDAERPGDAVLGEEYGTSGDTARRWVIDPIDGTHNYMRGIPIWATLIALSVGEVPMVGVVSQPALGRRWWAATGHGAWTNTPADEPRRIHVSAVDDVAKASVSFQSVEQWRDVDLLPALDRLTRAVWRDRGYGDALPYMWLAEGRLELVAEFGVKEYDVAALAPIVREAGGRFTAFDGSDRLDAGSSFATNGILHDDFFRLTHDEGTA
ncbi:inositol monophosphatase family protein [Microbacterium testaceum]|uniref:inositol monophosphatase family protein n=1 Tax=Microbacterium testaceum TaxID=2033 RepID=UPI0007344B0C|nr:inositol monophosphatase family protein [Microbacterium testaceum]KTS05691.1 histidinol phosphatase [Microbacterium testaceum]